MQPGDISEKCGCPDNELLTEEEWDEMADRKYDKMKDSINMWEMKGYRRKWYQQSYLIHKHFYSMRENINNVSSASLHETSKYRPYLFGGV